MSEYRQTSSEIWKGRASSDQLYLHEKIIFNDHDEKKSEDIGRKFALLGYACDEGVKRNQGRIGASAGPDEIRMQLAKMPNHLSLDTSIVDKGSFYCVDNQMEACQEAVAAKVFELLEKSYFPILLGGGHDIAYGHFKGIKKFLGDKKSIGIINFDAHFDLRMNTIENHSGTPFYQIAQDCKTSGCEFNYLCLGIRQDANNKQLYKSAKEHNVQYVANRQFTLNHSETILRTLLDFIREIDSIYITIDLDGFSSAYAPGVSASSPMGFTPEVVIDSLAVLIKSKKVISLDIAEMNPQYDIDNQTSKLAASLVHFVLHES